MRCFVECLPGRALSIAGASAVRLVACVLLASCSASSPPATSAAPLAGDGGSPEGSTAGDTWTTYAAAFFQTYCTACHNAHDSTGRDYTVQANVAKDKEPMRCGVAAMQDPTWSCTASPAPRQFPIGSGPKPTDAERARIVAWIDAGEP
jgi:predicted CXXCH cytochrome family protein